MPDDLMVDHDLPAHRPGRTASRRLHPRRLSTHHRASPKALDHDAGLKSGTCRWMPWWYRSEVRRGGPGRADYRWPLIPARACGAGYHDRIPEAGPRSTGVCDNCGSSEFKRRPDDNRADRDARGSRPTVAQTAPILPVLSSDRPAVLRTVDGMADIDGVDRAKSMLFCATRIPMIDLQVLLIPIIRPAPATMPNRRPLLLDLTQSLIVRLYP